MRDAFEFALLRGAVRRGIPVLGICRGAQVLNVALGGTLHQHLPDVLGHTHHQQGNAVFATSSIRTVPGTRVAALIGESSDAQCYHHQAIDQLGDGLIVSAQDADGVIEAVELDPAQNPARGHWRCSGTPRSGWTTCACSRVWSRQARRTRHTAHRKWLRRVGALGALPTQAGGPPARRAGGRLGRGHQHDYQRCGQPGHRGTAAHRRADRRGGRRRRGGPRQSSRSGRGRGWRPPNGPPALRAFAAVVDAHVDEFAALEVANSGHPIGNARWEAGHVRDVLQFYSATPERLSGKQIPVAGGLDVTFNEPLGVVGVITPWNFPMTIASWGFAPALAAGNAVLVKPAEWTPLTTIRLGELAVEAGLPADLFQVLPGKGSVVGERFVTHPDVRKIVFTGSTEVGTRVMAGAAAQVKRVTLELGGKSANIVFDDCDLERAAATAPYGVFDNAGQDCCARSRILVQRNVYDRFMELLEPAVKGVVVGDPQAKDTEMGPLVSKSHWNTVASYVPDDAPVAFRGDAPSGPGSGSRPPC